MRDTPRYRRLERRAEALDKVASAAERALPYVGVGPGPGAGIAWLELKQALEALHGKRELADLLNDEDRP